MSDTSETDAFFLLIDIDWDMEVEFARKLERERDEAIELLKKASEYSTTTCQENTEKFLRKISKRKDAKMSETPETDAATIASGGSWSFELRETCRRLEREMAEAQDALEFRRELYTVQESYLELARRERDELREELNDIRLNLGDDAKGYTVLHAVCALQNERDELRNQLKALREHRS